LTGLCADDIWGEQSLNNSLWTAKLFVLNTLTSGNAYEWTISESCWIQGLASSSSLDHPHGSKLLSTIGRWKAATRLSLADIFVAGDAFTMADWRDSLLQAISNQKAEICISIATIPMSKFPAASKILPYAVKLKHQHEEIFQSAMKLRRLIATAVDLPSSGSSSSFIALAIACSYILMRTDDSLKASCISALFAGAMIELPSISQSLVILSSFPTVTSISDLLRKESSDDLLRLFFILYNLVLAKDRMILLKALMSQTTLELIDCKQCPRLFLIGGWLVQDIIAPAHACDGSLFAKAFDTMRQLSLKAFPRALGYASSVISPKTYELALPAFLESLCQSLVSFHIQCSLAQAKSSSALLANKTASISFAPAEDSHVIVVRSPARIDLSGGWSDTPPVCYDIGGLVSVPILCSTLTIDDLLLI
jgi:hypothetical protein